MFLLIFLVNVIAFESKMITIYHPRTEMSIMDQLHLSVFVLIYIKLFKYSLKLFKYKIGYIVTYTTQKYAAY